MGNDYRPRHLNVVEDIPSATALSHDVVDPETPVLSVVPEHRVRVRLQYLDHSGTGRDRATEKRTESPWKWRADCTCGWGCLSWSWSREWDVLRSTLTRERWTSENGDPVGGALPMALGHLAEKAAAQSQRSV